MKSYQQVCAAAMLIIATSLISTSVIFDINETGSSVGTNKTWEWGSTNLTSTQALDPTNLSHELNTTTVSAKASLLEEPSSNSNSISTDLPELGTLALLGLGLIGLGIARRRSGS